MARRPIACVTGATGFLASELVAQLLGRGYRVHATVRSLANSERNGCLFDLPGATTDTLALFEADLLDDIAFDKCVAGAHCVFHTASPFVTSNITDPHQELIAPALTGTRNVFSSIKRAKASGAEPPRVVLTSSVAALMGTAEDKATYFDESDWNFSSRAHGNPPGNGLDMYRYSKVLTTHHSPLATSTHGTWHTTYWACTCAVPPRWLSTPSEVVAEREAWRLAAEQRLRLSTILPSFIVGPPRTPRTDGESLRNMRQARARAEGKSPGGG